VESNSIETRYFFLRVSLNVAGCFSGWRILTDVSVGARCTIYELHKCHYPLGGISSRNP
jgi:hypothetical protein